VGVALLSDDSPEQTTVVVHPLPNQNRLPAEVTTLTEVAARDGANLIILVVDPCDADATGKVIDGQGNEIGGRSGLWPCPLPPLVVDHVATALAAVATDPAIAMRLAVALSRQTQQNPGGDATEQQGTEKPATPPALATGGESPRIQLVADRGGVQSVVAAQPETTRVIDAAGTTLQSGNTDDGPGPSLYVWAAGLVVLLAALGWHLAATAPRRRQPLAVPLPQNSHPPNNHRQDDHRQDDATIALSQARPRGPRAPNGLADMVELFRQHVPPERQSRREPQCPRCGSFDARAASAAKSARSHYQCGYCGVDWTVTSGAPWPNVVINPRTGR
jgi:hypothetical protein